MQDVWDAADRFVDESPTLDDLRSHRMHLLAARRRRALGRDVPADLVREERRAAAAHLAAAVVLQRIRAAVPDPASLVLFKGIELAERYPDPATRPFGDIDLLAADSDAVQRALLEAGFRPLAGDLGEYDRLHHQQPLFWPGLPLAVEVHRRPAWPEWMVEPPVDEIVAEAVPSRAAEGLLAPAPGHHALLVAAHAWDFNPLGRALDLLDVQLLVREAGREAVDELARTYGLGRLWRTTLEASDALFGDGARGRIPYAARSLRTAQGPTVLGQHLRRWISPFWAFPPHRAVPASAIVVGRTFLPGSGESWPSKLRRAGTALRNAFRRRWHHELEIGDEARRRPPRRSRY